MTGDGTVVDTKNLNQLSRFDGDPG